MRRHVSYAVCPAAAAAMPYRVVPNKWFDCKSRAMLQAHSPHLLDAVLFET